MGGFRFVDGAIFGAAGGLTALGAALNSSKHRMASERVPLPRPCSGSERGGPG